MPPQRVRDIRQLIRDGWTILKVSDMPEGDFCPVCRLPYGVRETEAIEYDLYTTANELPFPGAYIDRFDNRPVRLNCGHVLGRSCALEWFVDNRHPDCPICRQLLVEPGEPERPCECRRCRARAGFEQLTVHSVLTMDQLNDRMRFAVDAAQMYGTLAILMRVILMRLYTHESIPEADLLHYWVEQDELHDMAYSVRYFAPPDDDSWVTDANIQEMPWARHMPLVYGLLCLHLERVDGRFFTPAGLRDHLAEQLVRELQFTPGAENPRFRAAIRMMLQYFCSWWTRYAIINEPRFEPTTQTQIGVWLAPLTQWMQDLAGLLAQLMEVLASLLESAIYIVRFAIVIGCVLCVLAVGLADLIVGILGLLIFLNSKTVREIVLGFLFCVLVYVSIFDVE